MRRTKLRRGMPLKVLLSAVLVLGLGGALGWRQWLRSREPFPDIRQLEMSDYLERPATLRGSVFRVRATVQQTLASSTEAGRLVMVMTMVPRDSRDAPEPLPVQVPAEFVGRMQTGRQFVFKVMVGDSGVLLAQDATEI